MKYSITVARTVYFYETFEIDAENREKASKQALNEISYLTNDQLQIASQEEFVNDIECKEGEE